MVLSLLFIEIDRSLDDSEFKAEFDRVLTRISGQPLSSAMAASQRGRFRGPTMCHAPLAAGLTLMRKIMVLLPNSGFIG
jgi:hypothetical protein